MGIGNLLLGDDGVGVHAAQALAQRQFSGQVEVLDVGTAFLDALPALADIEKIIVIDAVKSDGVPGSIYRMPLEKCSPRPLDTLHHFDIFAMLALAENSNPVEVVVWGVEPEKLDWGTQLSPAIARAMPDLLDHVCKELEV